MSKYLSESYDDCLRANTILLARAQDAESKFGRLSKERDELREALRELHDEATRIGEFLSRKGQGATALGAKCLKARKVLATKKDG